MQKKIIIVLIVFISLVFRLLGSTLNGQEVNYLTGRPYRQESEVTGPERERYIVLARSWASKLWTTNEAYKGYFKQDYRPAWIPLPGFWTNAFVKARTWVTRNATDRMDSQERIEVEFRFDLSIKRQWERCKFEFLDDKSGRLIAVRNYFYQDPNVPYTYGVWKPLRTDGVEARRKAAEYAAMFGVSNLWDNTKFDLCSSSFDGVWIINMQARANGYPAIFPVCIKMADLPGYPLGEWYNSTCLIPTNLPTKVMLTAEDGRKKGTEYLNKYFPLKDLIPNITFVTNRLEYRIPNYNYIRPADVSGFSDPQTIPIGKYHLVWVNTFMKPKREGYYPFIQIYLDAATGEMLGGDD